MFFDDICALADDAPCEGGLSGKRDLVLAVVRVCLGSAFVVRTQLFVVILVAVVCIVTSAVALVVVLIPGAHNLLGRILCGRRTRNV